MEIVKWCLITGAGFFTLGFLVSRNNPSLKVVNTLVAAGKVVYDDAAKLFKKL